MYNLPRFSSALLVLLIHTKGLTAFPYEIQPALLAPYPPPNASPSNDNPMGALLENRNLNLSDFSPSLRSLDVSANLSVNASSPTFRAFTPSPSAPNAPQVDNITAKSALNVEASLTPVLNLGQAAERYNATVKNASLSLQGGPPALRSAFENLPSNTSASEQRFLNLTSSRALEVPARAANISQVETRIPSVEAANATDLALRSSLEHALLVNNKIAAASVPQLTANVAPVAGRMIEAVNLNPVPSSAVNVPYIKVYPVDNLSFYERLGS